ncbi:MAG: hypothetical protein JSW39_22780 [Desulfobacterales bacterium]|nr:MAG: hypothetical protein JSW39_22780 [Desulfobacterales bacterium]
MPEYIDDLIGQAKKDLEHYRENRPRVFRNKNRKTIAAKYDFNFGLIRNVKLIAPYEDWRKLIDQDPDPITFETIEAYLSRPSKKILRDLEQYALNMPDWFDGEVWKCIEAVNAINPLHKPTRKVRGTAYGLDWFEMIRWRDRSRELYIFLQWTKKDDRKLFNDIRMKYGGHDLYETTQRIIEHQIEKIHNIRIDCRRNF